MNPVNEPTTHDAFLNVRRAYRLLHDYQRMVLDAVRYFQEQLEIDGPGAYQRFAGSFCDGKPKLDQSSWNWLPMVFCQFRFYKKLPDGKWLHLSFIVISDTGFFEGDVASNDKEKLSAFAPPKLSATKVALILQTTPDNQNPCMEDRQQWRSFIKSGTLPDDLIGKCYNMSDFDSMEKTDASIDVVIALAKTKSWLLERKKILSKAN